MASALQLLWFMTTRTDTIEETVPAATLEEGPVRWRKAGRWQLLDDDRTSRARICSPAESSLADIDELAHHDVPSLFLLLEGRITIVCANNAGELHEMALEAGSPVLISAAHATYCPDGPHRGVALVVERADLPSQWQPATHLEW